MQQVTQRGELPERISWARAMIFAVGYFFIAAILVGQLPSYLFNQMTASTLQGLEVASLSLAVACLGVFTVITVIVMLFDPKPVLPPRLFTGTGVISLVAGLALLVWANVTGCGPTAEGQTCNQYFPHPDTNIAPLLDGKFLWFQPHAIDFVMISIALIGVGAAMIFYSILAVREQKDPDRRDLGTTPAVRYMIIAGSLLLVLYLIVATLINDQGLAMSAFKDHPFIALKAIRLVASLILGAAILFATGAFALRLHYLMRPVRKRTMSALYAVGALGLAQTGAIFLLVWLLVYPAIAWIHSWSFIGLGTFLTVCARSTAVPASCAFSQDAGYLIDAIVTTNFFALLLAAVWAWKTKRNLVVVGSIVTVGAIAAATLLTHTASDQLQIAMALCVGMLILAAVWSATARREFAVVGENNLGCLGMWLVMGTCLFIYLGAFAFFSLPVWPPETEPNIPFTSGSIVAPPTPPGQTPVVGQADAIVMLIVMGVLAAIQFYFLTRNRYKV